MSRLKLLTLYGPIALGILALLLIVGGGLLMRRPPAPTSFDGSAWQDGLPDPRHRLRGDHVGSHE